MAPFIAPDRLASSSLKAMCAPYQLNSRQRIGSVLVARPTAAQTPAMYRPFVGRTRARRLKPAGPVKKSFPPRRLIVVLGALAGLIVAWIQLSLSEGVYRFRQEEPAKWPKWPKWHDEDSLAASQAR